MPTYRLLKTLVTALAATALFAPAYAETEVTSLQLNHINKMNARCMEHAQKADNDVAIAIYDQSGLLLSFIQSDDAAPAVGEVARWKALSSAYYRVPTATTAEWGIPNAPKIATIQGGLPILSPNGNPLGGIGVSGASSEFDEKCAALATQAAGLRN